MDLNSSQSRYNLRRRGQSIENPSVASESPDTFGRYVRHLADVALRNKHKVQYTVKRINRGRLGDISTDDDH